MAVPTGSLTTLATVKTELSISASTDDAYLERLIGVASDFVNSYCHRTFHYTTANVTEAIAGFGTVFLQVSRAPITQITSISFNSGAVDSTDYEIFGDGLSGLIYSPRGWINTARCGSGILGFQRTGTEQKLYSVVYKGGYVTPQQVIDDALLTRTLPYDLEDAVIQLVSYRYRTRGRDQSVMSESLLNASVSYKQPFVTAETLKTLLPNVYDVLRTYVWEFIL